MDIRKFGNKRFPINSSVRYVNPSKLDHTRGLTFENLAAMYQEDEELEPNSATSSLPSYPRPAPKVYDVSIKYPDNAFDEDYLNVPSIEDRLGVNLTYFYYFVLGLDKQSSQYAADTVFQNIKDYASKVSLQRSLPPDEELYDLVKDTIAFAKEKNIILYKPEFYQELLKNFLSLGFFELSLENRLPQFFKHLLTTLNPPGLLSVSERKAEILAENFLKDTKDLKKRILKALIESDFKRTDEQILSLLDGYYDVPVESLHEYAKKIIDSYRRAPQLKSFTERIMRQS